MPFTFSHPAVVVPFAGRRFIFSAAVIGSMTPDFESFIHLSTDVSFAHSIRGVFVFCLPAGLMMLMLFHRILKFPILSLLPESHQRRLLPLANEFHFVPFRHFILIVLSLLTGVFTHIIWDAFTHKYGWMVLTFPALSMSVQIFHHPFKLYNILQHGSSLAGLMLLTYWYVRWFKKTPPGTEFMSVSLSVKTKSYLIFCIVFLIGISAGTYGFFKACAVSGPRQYYAFILNTVLSGILMTFFVMTFFSIYWHRVLAKSEIRK